MRLQAFLLLVSFQLANSLHVAVSDAVESADVSACPNMAILTGTSGIIKSPSYPGKYGNYHRCSWKIMASTGYRVKLVIQDMDIEGGTNCPFDYIQIQNAVIYGSGVLPGRLCGSLTSNSTFSSYHETLIVRFVTDGSVTARGFKARYTVIPGCALNYKKVGCFKDDRKNPRPVPVLVFTDRDVSSNVWSGKTIDWSNWDTYIVDLVRRCANESRARNYFHFSIQYYGECWSGSEVAKTYDRAGPSESCLTKGVMQKCNASDDVECVGEANTNFVYEIKVPLILIGGSWPGEGRVEIYYNDTWGTVCDDSWDINDARVVCRQLGYSSAVSAPRSARFGQGSGKIWLDDVQCQGDESSIVNCRRSPWGVHNCGHSEDASVICSRT